jgi:hypothetical protein
MRASRPRSCTHSANPFSLTLNRHFSVVCSPSSNRRVERRQLTSTYGTQSLGISSLALALLLFWTAALNVRRHTVRYVTAKVAHAKSSSAAIDIEQLLRPAAQTAR